MQKKLKEKNSLNVTYSYAFVLPIEYNGSVIIKHMKEQKEIQLIVILHERALPNPWESWRPIFQGISPRGVGWHSSRMYGPT